MEENEKQRIATVLLSFFIIIITVFGVLYAFGYVTLPNFVRKNNLPEEKTMLSAQDVYSLALSKAKEWQGDAVLSNLVSMSGQTDKYGTSDNWEMIFVSPSVKGKGYQITIANKNILNAQEVPYVGKGAPMPEKLLTSQEAIAKIRAIKGYENVEIKSMEIKYDESGKWWWAVITTTGVHLTVQAEVK